MTVISYGSTYYNIYKYFNFHNSNLISILNYNMDTKIFYNKIKNMRKQIEDSLETQLRDFDNSMVKFYNEYDKFDTFLFMV